jgi:hypothetical protein
MTRILDGRKLTADYADLTDDTDLLRTADYPATAGKLRMTRIKLEDSGAGSPC